MSITTAAKDLYAILETSPRARPEIIRAAYHALMKIYHPDGGTNKDEELAREINLAYEILSDSTKKEEYDSARNNPIGTIIKEYRILEEIAEGGFGKTYKAEHLLTGELVCIKHCSKVSPQYDQVLIDEARAMWDLRHYAIPTVRDFLRLDDGSLALVMSYIPGPTLEKIIQTNGRLDAESVTWIMERVLNALQYMHYHAVVHGDIKPQNIIVQPDKHMVVIVDFGLAMIKPKAGKESKGFTPVFAPPEEIAGKVLVPGSDFYSLGKTAIYALSGSYDKVESLQVPCDTPDPLVAFIKRLIVHDVLARPHWELEDLCDTIKDIRKQCFGRTSSGMKPIPGF